MAHAAAPAANFCNSSSRRSSPAELKGFYDAESYHQDYALHNPDNPYILVCDKPKIEALKAEYPELFQEYKGK